MLQPFDTGANAKTRFQMIRTPQTSTKVGRISPAGVLLIIVGVNGHPVRRFFNVTVSDIRGEFTFLYIPPELFQCNDCSSARIRERPHFRTSSA